MAHKIIWSPEAVADLEEIRDFIARDSENYAAAFVERLLSAVEQLWEFPLLGPSMPEMNDEAIRQLIVGSFRVIYRAGPGSADIGAIVHGARDLPAALENRNV